MLAISLRNTQKHVKMSNPLFSKIPVRIPKRNKFNLSHEVKLTGEMGKLIPIMCEPVLPGESWRVGLNTLVRFAPMLAPIMSQVDVYAHAFFVPNRILYDYWEDFITGSHDGEKLSEEELPPYPETQFSANLLKQNPAFMGNSTLFDYLGFQTYTKAEDYGNVSVDNRYKVDDFPFRCYQKICDDYYRDENLEDPIFDSSWRALGPVDINSFSQTVVERYGLRTRAWRKDYFTSALPFPQKGDDVLLPLQGTANINGTGVSQTAVVPYGNMKFSAQDGTFKGGANTYWNGDGGLMGESVGSAFPGDKAAQYLSGLGIQANSIASHLKVDLSTATSTTIRELRRAYAAQRFLERRAVGGTRYIEQNFAMFGAKSSDGRLQRAQFLGGMKQPVVVSQVLQTSATTDNTPDGSPSPLAQPAGTANSIGGKKLFSAKFEEYGYVMVILSVIPKADYMQGIPRKYLKRDPYDFYWPQFAHIGEQEIKNQELYFDITKSTSADDPNSVNNQTFGYTPRYAEYRFINNSVHGDFRGNLAFWHMARNFSSTPSLNKSFIQCKPTKDVFAVQGGDHLWMQCGLSVSALRPLPKYGEPI